MTTCCCPCHETTEPGEMTPSELVRYEKLARTMHPAVAAVMAFELENLGIVSDWYHSTHKGAA